LRCQILDSERNHRQAVDEIPHCVNFAVQFIFRSGSGLNCELFGFALTLSPLPS